MKKQILAGILSLLFLLPLVPTAFAAEENAAFVKVSIDCPEVEALRETNYHDYSYILMRYADDKAPIPLSAPYDGRVWASIPAENAERPLEYFVSEPIDFADAPGEDDEYTDDSFNFYIMSELSAKGVVKGNEKGEALPFDNITRAEAVAMAMRLLGVDNMPDTDSGFSDVPKDAWYAAAVTKARKLGIAFGDDDTHFAPLRNVTREETVALIARCFWISGLQKEKTVSREELLSEINFADGAEISDWALSAYKTLKTYGTSEYIYDYYDETDTPTILAHPKDAATRFFTAYVILDGCDVQQVYPSQAAISFGFDKNMPKIDGSTSTYPFTDEVYRGLFLNGFSHSEMPEKHSKSHASYERLINGEVDVIFASVYPASDILELAKSKGVELELVPIAYDAMIFFTNADNPIEGLTKEQISDIYVNNKYNNWKALGGTDALLYPYCRNNDSGSHAQMERHFLNGNEINEKIREENTSVAMSNILTDVMSAETYDPTGYALGYSIYYYFQNMDMFYDTNEHLKLLKINGVYPDDDTIASGEYPLSNNTYLVFKKSEPQDSPARKMAEFMLTKEGQACVEGAGFGALYPTNPKEFKTQKMLGSDSIYSEDGTELVYISTKYPQILKKTDKAFVKSLNSLFESVNKDFISSVYELSEDISDYYKDLDEEDKAYLFPYENELDYSITRNSGGIFSITFEESFYTGGVHPFGDRLSFTYDTNAEKELSLCDILGKSQAETDKLVIQKFYEEYENEDIWDLEEEAPDVSFYIEEETLVLYFQQYQIAPYAMGYPEVRIPLYELKK